MSDFQQMVVISKYQFKNYLRAKRLLILLLITALVTTAIIIINIHFRYIQRHMLLPNIALLLTPL